MQARWYIPHITFIEYHQKRQTIIPGIHKLVLLNFTHSGTLIFWNMVLLHTMTYTMIYDLHCVMLLKHLQLSWDKAHFHPWLCNLFGKRSQSSKVLHKVHITKGITVLCNVITSFDPQTKGSRTHAMRKTLWNSTSNLGNLNTRTNSSYSLKGVCSIWFHLASFGGCLLKQCCSLSLIRLTCY